MAALADTLIHRGLRVKGSFSGFFLQESQTRQMAANGHATLGQPAKLIDIVSFLE